ncbi:ASCH domain-containing protein [Metallumcola ferriviriculae]|uniref:ASCH domain-containing protein n=1 Tax=Metallumcola ferriviriculae TaxID=3039180 RepID=A0AAU0UKP6_9FIRM|nr:ASCH domain-containing protein [Desulfitibacteraceae bacterium MK1]
MKRIVLSIKPQYVKAIIEGDKIAELRRKRPGIARGDSIYIYETTPTKAFSAVAEVKEIIELSIDELWERVREICAISWEKFNEYFKGCKVGYALIITKVKKLIKPLGLYEVREKIPNYRPPQFFHYVDNTHPIQNLIESRILVI